MSRNVARRQIATRSSYRRPNRAVGVREERRIGASQRRQAGAGAISEADAPPARQDRARRRLGPPSNSCQRHGAAPLPPRPRASAAHIAEDFEIERATLSAFPPTATSTAAMTAQCRSALFDRSRPMSAQGQAEERAGISPGRPHRRRQPHRGSQRRAVRCATEVLNGLIERDSLRREVRDTAPICPGYAGRRQHRSNFRAALQ